MVTTAYVFLVCAVALQRLLEMRVSRANEAMLKAHGGVEHAPKQMPFMIALHAAWLLCSLGEVALFERQAYPALLLFALILFTSGQALRFAAMHTLGDRWTTKIITVPGKPSIDRGVFAYLRHPNYLGVILEIAALPLLHSAYLTAIVFSIANGVLLHYRIAAEERALRADGDYEARLGRQPRLIPDLVELARSPRKRVSLVR